MITYPVPEAPLLPPDPVGYSAAFEASLQRAISGYSDAVTRRLAWLRSLTGVVVTDAVRWRQFNVLAVAAASTDLDVFPWKFNISSDGNRWWPSPSVAIAARERASGQPRGKLCDRYTPSVGGTPFTSLGPGNSLALSAGARTFWVRSVHSKAESKKYRVADTLRPARPESLEVINLALGDLPPETETTIFVPWVDVPPAAPPDPRFPTYHFSLWLRLSHYWRSTGDGDGGGSSRSDSSGRSSAPSGSHSGSKSSSGSESSSGGSSGGSSGSSTKRIVP